MTTNTQKSLIQMLQTECKLGEAQATHVGLNMVMLASAHLILTIREMNEGLGDTGKRHQSIIETWFELMAEELPGLTSAHFDGDVRASTVLLSVESGASNSFSGKWRVPVQMPATPSTALMRPIKQDIDHMRAAKAKRDGSSAVVAELAEHEHPLSADLIDDTTPLV